MSYIICTCGNKGCTTKIYTKVVSVNSADIVVTSGEKEISVGLDANSIIQLIVELRELLKELGQ